MQRDEILRVLKNFKAHNADRYKIVRLGLFGSGARDLFGEKAISMWWLSSENLKP